MSDLAEIIGHAEQASGKLKDLVEVHLPAIRGFLDAVQKNPLVTSVQSVVPGELSSDAQALLNAITGLVNAPTGGIAGQKSAKK